MQITLRQPTSSENDDYREVVRRALEGAVGEIEIKLGRSLARHERRSFDDFGEAIADQIYQRVAQLPNPAR